MRKVNYVKLHGNEYFVPEVGSLGNTLPSPNKNFDIDILEVDECIKLIIRHKGAIHECFIPKTNVVLAVYSPQSAAAISSPKSFK